MSQKTKRNVKPSEIVSLHILCGACGTTSDVANASFEYEEIVCGGCKVSYTGRNPTCMCESSKTVEFQCPACKYYGSIEVY